MRPDIWTVSQVSSDPQRTPAEDSCPAGIPSPVCRTWAPPLTGTENPHTLSTPKGQEARLGQGQGALTCIPTQDHLPPTPAPVSSRVRKGGRGCSVQGWKEPLELGEQLGPSLYPCLSPQWPIYCTAPFILSTQDTRWHLYVNAPPGSQMQCF